jgi:hypothetical protein
MVAPTVPGAEPRRSQGRPVYLSTVGPDRERVGAYVFGNPALVCLRQSRFRSTAWRLEPPIALGPACASCAGAHSVGPQRALSGLI